jgi:hypothetical protein
VQNPVRKKVLVLSIVAIIILSFLTVYELNKSSYYFEKMSGNRIDFSTFSIGEDGVLFGLSYAKEEYILIDDSDDWIDFLNRTRHSTYQENLMNDSYFIFFLEIVQLNFSEKIYFGAFWGYKTTGGYHIEIKDLVLDGMNLNVYIERSRPKGFVPEAITYPHHIIAINKEDVPSNVSIVIKFQEENNFYLIPLMCLIATIIISITFYRITLKHENREHVKNPPTTLDKKK